MNAQAKFAPDPADGKLTICTSRGIEWTHIFGIGTGYTANPVRGCTHGCQWRMPDGKIVSCYAETFADRLGGKGAFKNLTFHPDVLSKIFRHKEPAGIFIDSMSDLCGEGVDKEWIGAVIGFMQNCPQHIFFTLTKNPRRLTEFVWPDNAMVGISAPPTFMYGKELSFGQQQAWFTKGMAWLAAAKAKRKWVSLEPLSTGAILEALALNSGTLDWAVIGAGSDGRKTFQPEEYLLEATLRCLTCSVFFKGNLDRALAQRHGGWREEFPKL